MDGAPIKRWHRRGNTLWYLYCSERAKQMFYHAYDSYVAFAYPYDELRPLTCDGHDTWGR